MKKLSAFLLIICLLTICISPKADAKSEIKNEPYDTKIVGLDGQLVTSSMAYEGIHVLNPGFTDPQDLYIDANDDVYIADKSNKVIYKYNSTTRVYTQIGLGVLQGPTGVYVDDYFNIYVADYEARCVVLFNQTGQLVRKFERPVEPLFGDDSQYRPTKVAVDKRGNIYVTSEGNANGIIQINSAGEFTGYFGANNVNVTLSLLIRRMFLSKEDRETYASLNPKATSNLTIDDKNIVYTVIAGEPNQSMKKYNVNGTNMLPSGMNYQNNYTDIAVDGDGLIYSVSTQNNGVITVRDNSGNVLFMFGNTKSGSMLMGQFDAATGIDVDSNGNIWVLDGGGKNVQVFTKTEFASQIIQAMILYNNGDYEAAKIAYEQIVQQNSSFVQAYIGLGQISQRNQDFSLARDYFRIANYKSGYNDVFWELRDEWLGRNLLWMAIVIIILVALKAFKVKQKVYEKMSFDPEPIKQKVKNNSYYKELSYLPKMLKKPSYVFYDIKFLLKIRFSTALIVFVFFVAYNIICDNFITGYLFKSSIGDVNLSFELLKWGLIIILVVIANFLISSLQKGEGFFRDIFIGAMFSFAPLLIFKLPLALLSNVLTYNESYIYNIINMGMWAWSIFNLLVMFKTIHNFKLKELIVNIILTILAVIILVFIYLMVYILVMQFFQFFIGLIQEGVAR